VASTVLTVGESSSCLDSLRNKIILNKDFKALNYIEDLYRLFIMCSRPISHIYGALFRM
jgi:hypothetical protein